MSHKLNKPSLFFVLCLLGFAQISETIYSPSLPDLADALKTSMKMAEFTLSIYFIGFALGVLTFGTLADRIGRRKSMLIGILIYTLGSIGCSSSTSIEVLLLFRLIQAFGASTGSVVTQTILRDLYSGPERTRIFSIASGALAFSPALGPVIGGMVNQAFHWRANFYVLVAMGILLLYTTWKKLAETQPPASQSRFVKFQDFVSLMKTMIRDPQVLFCGFLIGTCNGIIFSYYAEAPYVFIEIFGLAPSRYGFLGLLISLGFVIASFLSLKLNRHSSSLRAIQVGSGLASLGSVLLSLVWWGTGHSTTDPYFWALTFASIFLTFLGMGVIIPNCISNALVQYQHCLGTAGCLFGFGYYVLIAGLTCLMGFVHNGTPIAMPLYFCLISFTMLGISTFKILKTS